MISKLIRIAFALSLLPLPVLADELVFNGDFETPAAGVFMIYGPGATFGGWTVDGAGVVHIGTFNHPVAYSGAQAVELNYYTPGGISQTLATQPGEKYKLTFAMAGQSNSGPDLKTMDLYWDGCLLQQFTWSLAATQGQWELHEVTLIAGTASTPLRFYGTVTVDGGPYIDAVSVVPLEPAPPSLVLMKAVSRKTHATSPAGVFDIDLPLSGARGVECRQGGPTQLILTFSKSIKAADGVPDATEVSLSGGTLGLVSICANTMTINLSDVPDKTCLTAALSGISDLDGNALIGASAISVRSLFGDVNGNGTVNILDLQAIKNALSQTVRASNFKPDVNLNGSVNILDLQATKNNLQSIAAVCP